MKNVLVIKGADFSAHKVKKIDIVVDEIPCTALEISESAHTATSFGIFSLNAIPTPLNTTDDVIWESSNENIATVSNGVVNVVGVGVVEITAKCGSIIAKCSVNASAVEMNDLKFLNEQISANGSVGSGRIERGFATKPNKFLGVARVSDDVSISTIPPSSADAEIVRTIPIVMPYGATKVRISSTSAIPSSNYNYVYWCDSKKGVGTLNATLYVNYSNIGNLSSIVGGAEYSVAEGADSCAITLQASSNIEELDAFIATYGLKFEFLA